MAKLDKKLVLAQFIMSKFGLNSENNMKVLSDLLREEKIGWDESNIFHFRRKLENFLPEKREVTDEMLIEYDSNVFKHWQSITRKRSIVEHRPVYPLYFQYLSLIFTEYYLDKWTSDKQAKSSVLLNELNEYLSVFNLSLGKKEQISEYTDKELTKLAFWIATGGGKTLIMHCNIRQFYHYINKCGLSRLYNKIVLISPNEGLSGQHLEEFELSEIPSRRYDNKQDVDYLIKQSRLGFVVEVTEVTKLKDTQGVTTINVEELGKNNIILVDEGHRGSGGDEWFSKRQFLCEDGFSFEYSATFGQAVNALNGAKEKEMTELYAKGILFDYSYKFFYGDGYGKDFLILNLKDAPDKNIENDKRLYLTACIMRFFQQCLLYREKKSAYEAYLVEDPLMIFVGGSVTGQREEKRDTDIVAILKFYAEFIADSETSRRHIELLITGRSGLGNRIDNSFKYLAVRYSSVEADSSQRLFSDIMRIIFQTGGSGLLHVDYFKGNSGEIGLRIGSEADYFGVINVGDASKLFKMIEEQNSNLIVCSTPAFSYSLFEKIKVPDSKIRILIGAKKFVEGWSSWRVSTMGLINVGKKEGSQIIQLFGRGVRLKGLDFCIKRSSEINFTEHPQYIEELETLNIFGVASDYMNEFDEYIEEEVDNDDIEIKLPVIENFGRTDIKVILPKKDAPEFKKTTKVSFGKYEKIKTKISADWYTRIEARTNRHDLKMGEFGQYITSLKEKSHTLQFLNYNALYIELLSFKKQNAMYNLEISKESIRELLSDDSWYYLFIPPHLLEFDTFEKVALWQEIAFSLLKTYCKKFYQFKKDEFEAPYREYRTLQQVLDDTGERTNKQFLNNLRFEYELAVKKSQQALINDINMIKEKLELKEIAEITNGNFQIFRFDNHLYQPLIHIPKGVTGVTVKPVSLNKHEMKFVEDMKAFFSKEKSGYLLDNEVMVLRNQSKGKGISFFDEGNFYPDFIIWIMKGNHQYIIFADPHGLVHARGVDDSKLQFCKTIKEIETQLGDKEVTLESYILSPTKFNDVTWNSELSMNGFEQYHVLFMYDDSEYISKIFDK